MGSIKKYEEYIIENSRNQFSSKIFQLLGLCYKYPNKFEKFNKRIENKNIVLTESEYGKIYGGLDVTLMKFIKNKMLNQWGMKLNSERGEVNIGLSSHLISDSGLEKIYNIILHNMTNSDEVMKKINQP